MPKKERTQKKTLVLLDSHAILHRAYHALPGFSSRTGEPTGALYGLAAMLMRIVRELKPDYLVAAYDRPEPTFRHAAYEAYKEGRPKADDELIHQIKRSRDVLTAFSIPFYEEPGFEADDILGTIVERLKKRDDLRIIIASGDMDTLQLVDGTRVAVYTLKKGINDTVLYDEEAMKKRFGFEPKLLPDWKGICGDPSDNIIGIKGIGEKTATALITKFGTIENIYRALKKDEGLLAEAGIKERVRKLLRDGEEEALFSKTLATIRRDAPIQFSIPEKRWSETLDHKKIDALFSELDFRSLRARVKELGVSAPEKDAAVEIPTAGQSRALFKETKEELNGEEFKKAQIALWLLRSDMTTPSREDILEFSGKDTVSESLPVLVKKLQEEKLKPVYDEIELPLVPIVKRAEERGIVLDVAHLRALSREYHEKLRHLEESIWKSTGEQFNINSPKQLGAVLFDKLNLTARGLRKTEGGARSTRESELQKLRGSHEAIDHILAYRELQKLLSTYIDNMPEMVGRDGRLHTSLNQAGTTTGRMSSTNPNLQNIPVGEGFGTAIRKAFIAAPNHRLLAGDYSQIEMRVLAELSGDEHLRQFFRDGKDVHAAVAAFVFGVSEGEVTKDMRRKAKVINFGIVYGMGVNALRENLGGSREEAQKFYEDYFKKFPRIAAYFEKTVAEARKRGYTETLFGRRRFFESIRSPLPYIRAAAERMAQNAPIQGTAADIVKLAMRKVDEALRREGLREGAHLILQVHDELIYEAEETVLPRAVSLIRREMEHAAELSVPLTVNISAGPSWGELREYTV